MITKKETIFFFFIKYDSSQNWKYIYNFYPPEKRNHSVGTYCRLPKEKFHSHTIWQKQINRKYCLNLKATGPLSLKQLTKEAPLSLWTSGIMSTKFSDNLKIHRFTKSWNTTQPRNTLRSCEYYLKRVFLMVIFLQRSQHKSKSLFICFILKFTKTHNREPLFQECEVWQR